MKSRMMELRQTIEYYICIMFLLKVRYYHIKRVNEKFETSDTTWKRDIRVIRRCVDEIFGEKVKLLKVNNQKAYTLYYPPKEICIYLQ
ncbi:MAG: hypothetical protein L6U99_05395 [Clostridium sp.]|nr:MAG: hypothetical protein L6U99_05395 [Clostridium sp.]